MFLNVEHFSLSVLGQNVGIHAMLVRILNREDPGQNASSEAV